MNTRVVCVPLVVGNIFADEIVLRYALHPTERFAEAAGYLFLSYMLAGPIVLFFLKGERIWRLVVIVLGLLPKPFFPDPNFRHLGFSLFFLVLLSSQNNLSVRSVLNLSLQLRDSRSIPSKNLL